MSTRTPRYEVVIHHVGIPCATLAEARAYAAADVTHSARIYRRTRHGYEEESTRMSTGTSGVSGLTGGNCTREEAEQYRREFAGVAGWDGTLPESQDSVSDGQRVTYLGHWMCPQCGKPIDHEQHIVWHAGLPSCRATESQEPVSDAELGWCADVAAWYEERS